MTELGFDLIFAFTVFYKYFLVVCDSQIHDIFAFSAVKHVYGNDVVLYVICNNYALGLGEVHVGAEHFDRGPGIDDTYLFAMERQPYTVRAHGGKLVAVLRQAQADIAGNVVYVAVSGRFHIEFYIQRICLNFMLKREICVIFGAPEYAVLEFALGIDRPVFVVLLYSGFKILAERVCRGRRDIRLFIAACFGYTVVKNDRSARAAVVFVALPATPGRNGRQYCQHYTGDPF